MKNINTVVQLMTGDIHAFKHHFEDMKSLLGLSHSKGNHNTLDGIVEYLVKCQKFEVKFSTEFKKLEDQLAFNYAKIFMTHEAFQETSAEITSRREFESLKNHVLGTMK